MFMMMPRKKYYKPSNTSWWSKLFLLFFFLPLFSSAQKAVFTPGIVVGLNTSQVSGDDLFGFHQFGAYGGLAVNAQLNETRSWQFQIAFSQKGSRKPSDANGTSSIYVLRFNYIDVPVIYNFRFKKNKIKNFHGEVGLINSYLINYSERNLYGNVYPARPFFKYELSGLIGLGYWMAHGSYFSLRYSNSILPIRKHLSGTSYYWNRGQYNTVVQFSFNYFFKKKD